MNDRQRSTAQQAMTDESQRSSKRARIARGVAGLRIGLGLAEKNVSGATARRTGVRRKSLLRWFGLREIGSRIDHVAHQHPAGSVWGRVAGEALELGTLIGASNPWNRRGCRAALATAAVVGVTPLGALQAVRRSRR